MLKYFIVLFCVFTVSFTGLLDLTERLGSLFTGEDKIPTKVRTIEEVDRKNEENETAVLDFIGIVNQHEGYEAEEYTVTTVDGYRLGLHRISASPKSPKAAGKPAVYIQHGIFGSSDFFVLLSPNQSLDFGYDVWIGNVRGNTYSRSHVKHDPKKPEFWNFSLDEAGTIDMAVFIDFILDKTERKDLTFIGYSMGATLSYILLSATPTYNEKINLLISISPVAYFTSFKSTVFDVLLTITTSSHTLAMKLDQRNTYEVLPQLAATKRFAEESCSNGTNPCETAFGMIADINNMNTTAIPTILTHIPAGTSYHTLKHFQQLIKSNGKFLKYDYDCFFLDVTCPNNLYNNKQMYNQDTPPEYDVSLITVPHAIFYAINDLVVPAEDIGYLRNKLNNDSVIAFEQVSDEKFNHLDFVWSNDARKLLYNRLIEIMLTNVEKKT